MRDTILNKLKEDFLDHMTGASTSYTTSIINCVNGIADFDSISTYPTIGYILSSDDLPEQGLDNYRLRTLNIVIYGVQQISYDNFTPLYELIEDIEKFLMSTDWTYTNDTNLGNVEVFAGGIEKERAYFTIEIQVFYTQEK